MKDCKGGIATTYEYNDRKSFPKKGNNMDPQNIQSSSSWFPVKLSRSEELPFPPFRTADGDDEVEEIVGVMSMFRNSAINAKA